MTSFILSTSIVKVYISPDEVSGQWEQSRRRAFAERGAKGGSTLFYLDEKFMLGLYVFSISHRIRIQKGDGWLEDIC